MELKTDYEINDSKLVYLVSENNDEAKDYLFEKYKPLIHKEINRYKKVAYLLGADVKDLSQEAMLAFSTAINNYNDLEDAKFITFATICIRRRLITYLKKFSTNKSYINQNTVSLDDTFVEDGNPLIDYIKEKPGADPLNKIIVAESLEEADSNIKNLLTEDEQAVLKLSIEGKSAEEIAEILNFNIKKVYNLIYRARTKIKKS